MITISTAIATVAEIKTLLGISVSTYDTLMGVYLPLLQDDLLNNILGNNFNAGYDDGEEDTIEPVFPQELKITMADYMRNKVINKYGNFTGASTNDNITSFSLDDYSVSYDKGNIISGVDKSIFANAISSYRKIFKDEPVKTVLS